MNFTCEVMKMGIKRAVKELFEIIRDLEDTLPERGELVIEDNNVPGGYYLTLRRGKDGRIVIEEGEYGRWARSLVIILEENEY